MKLATPIWILFAVLVIGIVGWIIYHQPWLILVLVGSTLGGAWSMWKFARQSAEEASKDNEMELISSQLMQQLAEGKRHQEADLVSAAQTAYNQATKNCPASYDYLLKYLLSRVWQQKGSPERMQKALNKMNRTVRKIQKNV
jgi:hypothetical protein